MAGWDCGRALSAVAKRAVVLLSAAAALAAAASLATAALKQGGEPIVRGATKVTICHATSSDSNPYVLEQPDDDSIVTEHGHDSHPDDIIPPFFYVDGGETKHYEGKNWDAQGEAIWTNGCEVSPPAPKPLPVQPVLKCVDDNGPTFTAVFGYSNPNAAALNVSVGSGNSFSPGAEDRGQPSTFQPGTQESAVTVIESTGSTLVWSVTVGGVTSFSAGADASFPTHCSTEPPLPSPKPINIFVKSVHS